MSVRVRVCICACSRACPRFALWHFIPTSFFFLLLSFSLSLLCSSLSLTLSLSPCLLMTQRCAKNFLCSMRTHYCKPISHTEVYTRSRSRTLAAFITLEKWVVSGKKKRLHLRLRTGIKVSLPTTGTQRYTMNCGLEAAEEKVKEKVCFLNVSVWRCIYITWTPSVWV